MKISTKLFLSFITIAVISTFVSSYSAISSISDRYQDLAVTETQKLKKQTENQFFAQLGELSRKCYFVSELNEVVSNFNTPNIIATELELKAFFLSSINSYILDTKNRFLTALTKTKGIDLNGETISRLPFFDSLATSFVRESAIVKSGKTVSMISVAPIVNQESFEKLGNTILEQVLDSEFCDKIRGNYRTELMILSEDAKLGTTFIDKNGERYFPNLSNSDRGKIFQTDILDNPYLVDRFEILDKAKKKIGDIYLFLNIKEIVHAKDAGARSILLVTALAILLTVLLSVLMGRRLAKPIKHLSQRAELIAKGDFDSKIIPSGKDEIGKLSETFNKMTDSLKEQTERIKQISFYLRNIIDSMPSMIVGIDSDGKVTQWNSEAEKSTGISMNAAIGQTVEDLFPILKEELANYKKAIGEKEQYKIEKLPITIESELQYIDIMIYPLITNGVTGAVIRIDNVTERIRLEEIMIQTEKMMSIGGLAAGMAHEINNPLGGILIGVQNIRRRLSDSLPANSKAAEESGLNFNSLKGYLERREIHSFLEGIQEAGERASTIVDNMLSFSRKSSSDFSPASLGDILDKTIELAANDYNLKKKYDFKHLTIDKAYDSELPEIPCVETEIQQVILNLLKNAVHSIFEKETDSPPKIVIRLMREEEMARIEVEDNGIGMSKETANRIFEPFFTTKGVGIGTGLGLSVSYFIITNIHKGSMQVQSQLGKGSTFIIRIPLSRPESSQ